MASLLVYKNARDFCVSIVYLANLPYALRSTSAFVVTFSGCSMYNIMSSANSSSFSSFLNWIPFISFSSLTVVARTSKTILNNSDESGHLYCVPDLRGNAFTIFHFWEWCLLCCIWPLLLKTRKNLRKQCHLLSQWKNKIPERNPSKKAKDLWSGIYKIPKKKKKKKNHR